MAIFLDNSHWVGNVSINNEDAIMNNQSGAFIVLKNGSSWLGDLEGRNVKEEIFPNNYVTHYRVELRDGSFWKGNADIQVYLDNKYEASHFFEVYDDSTWMGNVTLHGGTHANVTVLNNSTWIGDLDLRDNHINTSYFQNGGSVVVRDSSFWQGKIDGSEHGADVIVEKSDWLMTGDSLTNYLFLEEDGVITFGGVELTGNTDFSTLTVQKNLLGGTDGSRIHMKTDLASNQGDLLDVKGAVSGQYKIGINNQGGAWVNPETELTIAKTGSSASDAFSLVHLVEVGGFKYNLKQVGSDWNLYSTGEITPGGEGAINAFSGAYLLNYAENQTLIQRLGDLRQNEAEKGIWAKAYGGEFKSSADSFSKGFGMTYSGIQVGGDRKITLKEGQGELYLGGMFGYGKGNMDHRVGSGSVDSKTLGVYATRIAPNGFYADIVFKYGWMKNEYKVLDTAGMAVKADDIDTHGFTGSLEFGRRIHKNKINKEGWYVEPQVQLSVGRQSGGSFTTSNGLHVEADSYHSVLGRFGMLAGYEVKSGRNPMNVYAKISSVHELDGDMAVRFNGIEVDHSLGDSWITYGIGATAQFSKKHNIYMDIERTSGGKINQSWALNGGYRFEW